MKISQEIILNNSTVILIAVRLKSKRLPKKALKKIKDKTILEHLVSRMNLVKEASDVIVCTSTNSEDDPIEDLCKLKSIKYFRGYEDDVIGRFLKSVEDLNPKNIVRVTGDNCLVSHEFLNDAIIDHNNKNADYTTTDCLPRGMRGEVISYHILKKLHQIVVDPNSSEYMTWMIDRPDIFNVNKINVDRKLNRPTYRVTCDTSEDFELINKVYDNLYEGIPIASFSVTEYLDKNPDIVKINQNIKQKSKEDVLKFINVDLKDGNQ